MIFSYVLFLQCPRNNFKILPPHLKVSKKINIDNQNHLYIYILEIHKISKCPRQKQLCYAPNCNTNLLKNQSSCSTDGNYGWLIFAFIHVNILETKTHRFGNVFSWHQINNLRYDKIDFKRLFRNLHISNCFLKKFPSYHHYY